MIEHARHVYLTAKESIFEQGLLIIQRSGVQGAYFNLFLRCFFTIFSSLGFPERSQHGVPPCGSRGAAGKGFGISGIGSGYQRFERCEHTGNLIGLRIENNGGRINCRTA